MATEQEIDRKLGRRQPADGEPVACDKCDWSGIALDMVRKDFNRPYDRTLSGRDGWHWHCPECGQVLWVYYWRLS